MLGSETLWWFAWFLESDMHGLSWFGEWLMVHKKVESQTQISINIDNRLDRQKHWKTEG